MDFAFGLICWMIPPADEKTSATIKKGIMVRRMAPKVQCCSATRIIFLRNADGLFGTHSPLTTRRSTGCAPRAGFLSLTLLRGEIIL